MIKRKEEMKTLIKASMVAGIGLLMACTSENAQQQGDIQRGGENIVATFTGQHSDAMGKTRTIATHTKGDVAHVSWIPIDRIWVKATNGVFYQSGPADTRTPSLEGPRAYFSLTAGEYGFNPVVHYTGASTSYDRVNILSQQSGGAGSFAQLSNYGDCGSATAVGGGGDYEFTLNHKASYLCLYPRFENVATNPNVRLTKITISSTGVPLAGTFDFADGKIKDKPALANGSTTITANVQNDRLPVATSDANSYYFVLRPSSTPQTLTVVYTINDPTANVSVDIAKTITTPLEEGKIYDYTAWIDRYIQYYNNTTTLYYMWDAQQHYWWGHLKADGTPDDPNNYPKSKAADPNRWYNDNNPGYPNTFDAQTAVFKTAPNANEICWYVTYGDPHWDTAACAFNGHLQRVNGLWLRKKAAIVAYLRAQGGALASITWEQMKRFYRDPAVSFDRDMRVNPSSPYPEKNPTQGTPSPLSDYFFLPASGDYISGIQRWVGSNGCYWSSSACTTYFGNAFSLNFDSGRVHMGIYIPDLGYTVRAFE